MWHLTDSWQVGHRALDEQTTMNTWKSTAGQKYAKGFFQELSDKEQGTIAAKIGSN
jgi:hypothetical protein